MRWGAGGVPRARASEGATKNFEICFYFITLHAVHGASGAPETMQNIVKCASCPPPPTHRYRGSFWDRVSAAIRLGLGLILQRPPGVAAVASMHKAQQQQLDMFPLLHTH